MSDLLPSNPHAPLAVVVPSTHVTKELLSGVEREDTVLGKRLMVKSYTIQGARIAPLGEMDLFEVRRGLGLGGHVDAAILMQTYKGTPRVSYFGNLYSKDDKPQSNPRYQQLLDGLFCIAEQFHPTALAAGFHLRLDTRKAAINNND